jgi:DNA invertase Pin-like site-specific DNA recombinase/predicted RecB family endonuclease
MQAITYIRFSTLEQAKGHSTERQRGDCAAYIKRHGWTFTGEEIRDEGKSAYDGTNILEGDLGKFITRVERGHYGPGHVLVVERLDRLSRKKPKDVWQLVSRLTDAGMSIATVDGDQIYRAGEDVDLVEIITMVVKASLSYEESDKKSQIISSVYQAKREALTTGKVMTGKLPGWLTLVDGKICAIPERVTVVRRIFELSDAGIGRQSIARRLNEEGVPVWGGSDGWYTSFIQKLLRSPSVIGEYQPYTSARGTERRPAGDVVKNYFPAIITADQFERLNDRRALAQRKSAGIRHDKLKNIFSGIATCHACRGPMVLRNKKVGENYLACDKSLRSKCDQKARYRYEHVREAILNEVLDFSLDDLYFSAPDELTRLAASLAQTKREMSNSEAEATRLLALYAKTDDESVEAAWSAARSRVVSLKEHIKELSGSIIEARGAVSPAAHINRVAELREDMDSPDCDVAYSARFKVQSALRGAVREIAFNRDSGTWGDATFSLTMRGDVMYFLFEKDGTPLLDISRKGDGTELDAVAAIRRRALTVSV